MPIDPWGRFNEGLQGMQNTMMSLAALKRQDAQDARANSLQSLQLQQAQQGIDETNAKRTALADLYGTTGQSDAYPRALGFQAQEAKMQEEQALKAAQQKQQMEKSKFSMDLLSKTSEAVKNEGLSPEDAAAYYRTHMKLNGLDYSGKGVDITFKKKGGYYSGPITPAALVMVNGKPTPYDGNGTISKARIAGMDEQTGRPIFEFDEHTTYEPTKPKDEETWGEPYVATIGGKKAMVQKSSRGQVKPVIQDTSTTVKITNNGTTGDDPQVKAWADKIAKGEAGINDIPGRGPIRSQTVAYLSKNYPDVNLAQAGAQKKWTQSQGTMQTLALVDATKGILNDMRGAYGKLDRTSIPAVNAAQDLWQKWSGNPDRSEYMSLKNYGIQEVEKMLSGSGAMSDHRIKLAFDNLKESNTPDQFERAVSGIQRVMGERERATRQGPYSQAPAAGKAAGPVTTKGGFKVTVVK